MWKKMENEGTVIVPLHIFVDKLLFIHYMQKGKEWGSEKCYL